jgi:hypothetical protein
MLASYVRKLINRTGKNLPGIDLHKIQAVA